MVKRARLAVAAQLDLKGEEAEAKIADIEAVEVVVVDGVGAKVPGLGCIFAELNSKDGLELSDFLMC
jgi:hypothetical protein